MIRILNDDRIAQPHDEMAAMATRMVDALFSAQHQHGKENVTAAKELVAGSALSSMAVLNLRRVAAARGCVVEIREPDPEADKYEYGNNTVAEDSMVVEIFRESEAARA